MSNTNAAADLHHCSKFCSGRSCKEGKNCPLSHHWKCYNAARKLKKNGKQDIRVDVKAQISSSQGNHCNNNSPLDAKKQDNQRADTGGFTKMAATSQSKVLENHESKQQLTKKPGGKNRNRNNKKQQNKSTEIQQPKSDPSEVQQPDKMKLKKSNPKTKQRRGYQKLAPEIPQLELPLPEEKSSAPQPVESSRSLAQQSQSSSPSDDTFDKFCELPIEIRLKIWQAAIKSPVRHIIRVRQETDNQGENTFRFSRRSSRPALLLACKESRQEALKYYNRAFGTATSIPVLWVNYNWDMVFLNTRKHTELFAFIDNMKQVDTDNVQNLIIKIRDWTSPPVEIFCERIWRLKSLKRLILLVSDQEEDNIFSQNPDTPRLVRSDLAEYRKAHGFENRKLPRVILNIVPGIERHDQEG